MGLVRFSRSLRPFVLMMSMLALAACGDDDRDNGECTDTECGGACVNTSSSFANCGTCGHACMTGQLCTAGVCQGEGMGCSVAGQTACNGACVDTTNDMNNCGRCGASCLAGSNCIGGVCGGGGTDAGVRMDGGGGGRDSAVVPGDCVPACDPMRSSSCGSMSGGPMQCLCGSFGQCPSGNACVPSSGSFICANLQFDPMNCGAVGNACSEGESCNAGMCSCGAAGRCGDGEACCAGVACENVDSSAENCGMCGNACGMGETCVAGACSCGGMTCTPPMAGMVPPGEPGQSCCGGVCTANTDMYCNCEACPDGESCIASAGSIIMPSDVVQVCCADTSGIGGLLGCGGFGLPGAM